MRAQVGRPDALSQSDSPTAIHGEGKLDSSASSGPHVRHLPSSCAEIIVSRTSYVRSHCYTIWMESTQPTRVATTSASTSSLCQSLERVVRTGLARGAFPGEVRPDRAGSQCDDLLALSQEISSRSVLASCRSRVSNPSLNQS